MKLGEHDVHGEIRTGRVPLRPRTGTASQQVLGRYPLAEQLMSGTHVPGFLTIRCPGSDPPPYMFVQRISIHQV